MDFTADGILARMKGSLKNEDSRIEGSFTMDNLQAVSEELAGLMRCSLLPCRMNWLPKEVTWEPVEMKNIM